MQSDDFSALFACGIKHQAIVHNQLEITSDSADTTARSITLAKKKRKS